MDKNSDTNKKPDRSAYMREYYLKRREEIRLNSHARYLDQREKKIKTSQDWRKKQGATTRDEAPVGKRIETSKIRRRWLVIKDRIYFNSRLGFSMDDLLTAMEDLQTEIKRLKTRKAKT